MKKVIKILSLFVLLPVISLFITGCDNNSAQIAQLQKQNQDLQAQLDQQKNNNLDSQAQCATQADKALKNFEKDYSSLQYDSFSQENHYNQKMNKCFVLISYSPVVGPDYRYNPDKPYTQPTNEEDLLDAYGGRDLAHCTIFGNDNPMKQNCWTDDNGMDWQAYKNYVLPRMEMADPDASNK